MTVGGMMFDGSSPPSATPATGNISLIKVTPSSASPLATASATSDPGPRISFVRDRRSAPKPRRSATPINVAPSWVPAFGSDSATVLAMSIARLTPSGVLTSSLGAPARTATPTCRQIPCACRMQSCRPFQDRAGLLRSQPQHQRLRPEAACPAYFRLPNQVVFQGNSSNLASCAQLDLPPCSGSAGQITSTANYSRQIQFALRLIF